jgi:phosphate transport system substrate-binding protein
MKKDFIAVVLHLMLGLGLGFASADARAETEKLTITGSSTVAPLVAEIAKRFEEKYPGTRIDVQTGGSSRGISDVRQNLANLGMVSRALKADEKDILSFPIANDGVGIIVHKTNPLKNLTDDQIVAIFTGKIKNWKDVGGLNSPVTVVNKAEGRSTLELFLSYFKLKPNDIKAHVVIGDNAQGIKTVAGNPGAIGYVSIGTAEYDAGQGVPIKLLPMAGIEASIKSVQSGRFPLSRPLNLTARETPRGLHKKFIEFSQSKEVKDLVEQQYFVPLSK